MGGLSQTTDNAISISTGYNYLGEGIAVLAAQAPRLESALLAAKIAGYSHVNIDGTLIETDRCHAAGPTPGVDLLWSGKHHHHGGNVQVITAPDGWPLWTSPVRPGREHDTTAVRTHEEILPLLARIRDDLRTLADLGYEGESETICPGLGGVRDADACLAVQAVSQSGAGVLTRWVAHCCFEHAGQPFVSRPDPRAPPGPAGTLPRRGR